MEENEVVVAPPKTETPVFDSLAELESYNAKQQNNVQEVITEVVTEKKEEVQVPEQPIIDKQPEFDASSYLKGIFGEEFDTPDKLKAAISKAYEIPEDLKPLIDDAKFFRDKPQLLEWVKLADKGADVPLAWQATQLDVAKLEPKDALILDLVLNKGLSKEEATAKVELSHKVAFGSDDDYEANEKLAAGAEVKLQAKEAKERLVKFQQDMRLPEPERKAAELKANADQIELQRKTAWKPVVKEMPEKYSVNFKGEFGKDDMKTPVDFNFAPDEAGKKSYADLVESIVNNPNFTYNEQNREYVRQLADALYWQQNREAILNKLVGKAIEDRDTVWHQKVYGTKPRTDGALPDNFNTKELVVHDSRDGESGKYGKW